MAVSVEALVFIVIGRSRSKGCGFDSHCRLGSFLRFHSRPIMYGAVGSLLLSWSWTRQPGLSTTDPTRPDPTTWVVDNRPDPTRPDPIRQPGLSTTEPTRPDPTTFWCLCIQLCNNLGQRLCAYNLPYLTKLFVLSGSVNWYRQ